MNWIAIGIGAALGAIARHQLSQFYANTSGASFNVGILIANILGSFCIGLLYSIANSWPEVWRLTLVTGFLGALTTFSSFSLDVNLLFAQKLNLSAVGLAAAHLCGGLLACRLGLWITRYSFFT